MPNARYNRGSGWELNITKRLTAFGFVCIRSAGSHSPIDVVAFDQGLVPGSADSKYNVLLIQCKSSLNERIPDIKSLLAREQWKDERQKYLDGLALTKGRFKIKSNVVMLEEMIVSPFTRKMILWKGYGKQNYYCFTFKAGEWRGKKFREFSQII
jgi:hypothetical protein